MPKQYMHSFKAYPAWDYQSEIDELNRQSEQGWQLLHGGCFGSKFVKNPAVRYRYQLDFRRVEDKARYIETFREQGWEYVDSTINNWHFFRKLYDPALPEEAYEIFTDRESLTEMRRRWTRIASIIGIVVGLAAVVYGVRLALTPNWPALAQFLTFAIESAFLLRGAVLMRRRKDARGPYNEHALFAAFLIVLLLGCAAGITLTELRPNTDVRSQTEALLEPTEEMEWTGILVRYADNYYLSLEIEAAEPLTFSVVSAAGETVYTKTATNLNEKNIRLRLTKGEYLMNVSASSCFKVRCEID